MGFVFRSCDQLGFGYLIIIYFVLNEFMDDFCVKFVIQVFEGIQVDRFVFVMMYGKFIYLVEIGLVFYYIGYILGMDKYSL